MGLRTNPHLDSQTYGSRGDALGELLQERADELCEKLRDFGLGQTLGGTFGRTLQLLRRILKETCGVPLLTYHFRALIFQTLLATLNFWAMLLLRQVVAEINPASLGLLQSLQYRSHQSPDVLDAFHEYCGYSY